VKCLWLYAVDHNIFVSFKMEYENVMHVRLLRFVLALEEING
jgi:hypothetical protein